MTRLAFILLVAICAGCSGTTTNQSQVSSKVVAPVPPSIIKQRLAAMTPPQPRTVTAGAQAVVPAKPVVLEWDNGNDPNDAVFPVRYMLTEFHSRTNFNQPFRFKCYVSGNTNQVAFMPTNSEEYFICRFVWTNVTPWYVTGWNER